MKVVTFEMTASEHVVEYDEGHPEIHTILTNKYGDKVSIPESYSCGTEFSVTVETE